MIAFIRPDTYFFDPDSRVPEKLYHGTSLENSKRILIGRASLTCSREDLDFGPGLYTTRDPVQGFKWAVRQKGACLVFVVDRDIWQRLDCVVVEGENWTKLVIEFLCNQPWAQPRGDVIEGPVCKNPDRVRLKGELPNAGGTQTVFRTQRSLDCIDVDPNETFYPSSHGLKK